MRENGRKRFGDSLSRAAVWCAGAFLAALLLAAPLSCTKPGAAPPRGRGGESSVPVTVAVAEGRPMPVEISEIGSVMAYSTVSVRAEVSGILTAVHFRKGQEVKKGDVLFTIDPRPFDASLKQAQAALARDQAQAENARLELQREKKLLDANISAPSDYDKKKADAEATAAVVRADEAVVDNAKLQLEHCTLHSPIDGRTGDLLVDPGNLVKASSDQALVVINQVQPIQVSFSILQRDLPAVRRLMSQGTLEVRAYPSDDPADNETGVLTFIDNAVDKGTGRIALLATFPNAAQRLWPGQHLGKVSLILSTDPDAVVVPAKAVQTGRNGKYVYVIKDKKAEFRPVTVRSSDPDIAVLESGLAKGETVVTDGHLRLVQGSGVDIRPATPAAAEGSPTRPATSSATGGTVPATASAPAKGPATGTAPASRGPRAPTQGGQP